MRADETNQTASKRAPAPSMLSSDRFAATKPTMPYQATSRSMVVESTDP